MELIIETKICNKCKKELTLDMFGSDKSVKSGLRSVCKKCRNESGKQYRKENLEKILECDKKSRDKNKEYRDEYNKKYREEHAEELRIRARLYHKENAEKISDWYKNNRIINRDKVKNREAKYQEENSEKIKENRAKYREENAEKIYEDAREYSKNNRDKCNIKTQRYRAKVKLLPHTLTLKQWEETKLYFDNKCCYCGQELPLEQEHWIAANNGGAYTKENIVCACRSCNASKNDSDFFEWYVESYKYFSEERETKILEYLNLIKEDDEQEILAN
jgi:hypothetical protein